MKRKQTNAHVTNFVYILGTLKDFLTSSKAFHSSESEYSSNGSKFLRTEPVNSTGSLGKTDKNKTEVLYFNLKQMESLYGIVKA